MKAFTLDLSKEDVLLIQLKLPKGYSLVRTTKESKKRARTSNISNVSVDTTNHDLPSEEFEPNKSRSKAKASKIPSSKAKG